MAKKDDTAKKRKKDAAEGSRHSKHLFLVFFIVLLVLAFLVVRPFVTLILASAIFSYVLFPLFRRLRGRLGIPWLAALICILLALLVVAIPFFFVTTQVVDEGYSVFLSIRDSVDEGGALSLECENRTSSVCDSLAKLDDFEVRYGIDLSSYVAQGLRAIASKAVSFTTGLILGLPAVLFQLFVMIFLLFFMLIDGEDAFRYVKRLLPLTKSQENHVITTFKDLIHATLYGAVLVCIIQGSLAGLGFLIFGVDAPFLWGMLSIIAAFIPFVGAAIIWLPIVLKMVLEGLILSNNILLWKAFGLTLFCVFIVGTIDNILKPKIIGDRAKLHPVIVLLGVFGGLAMFGFVGLFIGPLLLALFMALLKIYELEKDDL